MKKQANVTKVKELEILIKEFAEETIRLKVKLEQS